MELKGYVAYDTNLRSIDGASVENGEVKTVRFNLSRIVEVHHSYLNMSGMFKLNMLGINGWLRRFRGSSLLDRTERSTPYLTRK